MLAGIAKPAEIDLELLGLFDGMRIEHGMHGGVGGDKGKTVGDFEAPLAEGLPLGYSGDTQGGFMDELEGEPRVELGGVSLGPIAKEIPGTEAQVFGDQEP